MKIHDPSTGTAFDELSEDTSENITRKAASARAAQPRWAARSAGERIDLIRRFRDLLIERKEELARILSHEVGKPITQARNELSAVPARIDFFCDNLQRACADETVLREEGLEERICFEPLGVVANISAWNYPWFVGVNVFVPALLTGNTVLYKPSEFAALVGLSIAGLMRDAGVPEDVFIPVIGGGAAGAALIDAGVDAVCFTGSYATGVRIAQAASKHLLKVQLELGGKDPAYITDDVDIDKAVGSVADGAFYNTGQSCCSIERIYVHEKIYDAFVERFVKEVKGYKVGDPHEDATYIGPLTRAAQLDVLTQQIADAKAKGGRVLLGGKRMDRPGNYFEPTVVVDTNNGMELMREESFGPVIGIARVKDDAEALRLMNDTAYGLTAGVYCREQDRASHILSAVRAGSAYWNCCDRVSPRLPWSGRGHSGLGTTLSVLGIRAFVQPKAWHLRKA
ncbi:MAG TPA: aldehyde dehydrogenase family protein [Polyangiales bacterium]|nr:aldehyde dehydrogenase family protein [Polyangiales bacterium]